MQSSVLSVSSVVSPPPSMSDPAATPMMQQYRELKARDPEALDVVERFLEAAPRGEAMPAFMVDPLG